MKYLHFTTSQTPSSDYFGGHVWLNKESNKMSYTFGTKIATLKNVIENARKVRDFIDEYKKTHTSITNSSDLILAQYGRIGRYNDWTWGVAGGTIDSGLKAALDEKFLNFQNIQEADLPNGDSIDVPHFWAVVNTIMTNFGDLGGWAGDLVEYAALLQTSPDEPFPTIAGGFDRGDWNSDADGYNVMKTYSNDLLSDMQAYFTKDLTEKQRVDMFITADDIETRFINSPNYTVYLRMLMTKYNVSSIHDAAVKMQAYLDANK